MKVNALRHFILYDIYAIAAKELITPSKFRKNACASELVTLSFLVWKRFTHTNLLPIYQIFK